MKCPHCTISVRLDEKSIIWQMHTPDGDDYGYGIFYAHCPDCNGLIVWLKHGNYYCEGNENIGYDERLTEVTNSDLLYPKYATRVSEPEVPNRYRKDFSEASQVLSLSPKASAALSRRMLQDILREHFKIQKSSLALEIEEFIHLKDIPSYLTDAVDAVRNIGNFAAHPLKNNNTGEVVDVEPGEADWLLDVIESLFDFVFVQPKRLEERKNQLNQKLKNYGKPPMKNK